MGIGEKKPGEGREARELMRREKEAQRRKVERKARRNEETHARNRGTCKAKRKFRVLGRKRLIRWSLKAGSRVVSPREGRVKAGDVEVVGGSWIAESLGWREEE